MPVLGHGCEETLFQDSGIGELKCSTDFLVSGGMTFNNPVRMYARLSYMSCTIAELDKLMILA